MNYMHVLRGFGQLRSGGSEAICSMRKTVVDTKLLVACAEAEHVATDDLLWIVQTKCGSDDA